MANVLPEFLLQTHLSILHPKGCGDQRKVSVVGANLCDMRHEEILRLLAMTPGVEVLAALVDIDPFTLSRVERIDYLSAVERQASWLQSLRHRAVVAVAGEEATSGEGGIDDAAREEVAAAMRLSQNGAQRRIDTARSLLTQLPLTRSALETGEISPEHATAISEEIRTLIRSGADSEVIARVEGSAIAHAEFHTPNQVARKVRDLVAREATAAVELAATSATELRKVSIYPDTDGMATLVAYLPAADAQAVMLALDAWARAASEGTIDQRRADALTALTTASLVDAGTAHGRPVAINVTIDLPTLLGLADNPAQLAGYGAIPASVARALAADGTWRRLVTDPVEGHLLDFGRRVYRPPQALVDFLTARDRTCRFPGCRQPAWRADLDHAEAWDDGGATSAENLGVLCRRHHRLKTHHGWQIESRSDGSCLWTSPTGHHYLVPARPVLEAA